MNLVAAPLLAVENLSCAYADHQVVNEVSFSVGAGEIACLLGPSGCGKTTILRSIAGFMGIAGGDISLNGCVLSSPDFVLPPEKREMGMVFQDYALFPHLTVAQNIRFGLSGRHARSKADIRELLDLVRLPNLLDRYPHELSGGQQQRVALARALAPKPRLLLMDEPFSNLDTDLRQQLALEIREILKQQGIGGILVTHDQQEAFAIGDQVGVISDGQLQQWGTPEELYYYPENEAVADFVGRGAFFEVTFKSASMIQSELGAVELPEALDIKEGENRRLFLRPSEIHPLIGGEGATVANVEFLGETILVILQLASTQRLITTTLADTVPVRIGDQVGVSLNPRRYIFF